jgi:hypothetical protein
MQDAYVRTGYALGQSVISCLKSSKDITPYMMQSHIRQLQEKRSAEPGQKSGNIEYGGCMATQTSPDIGAMIGGAIRCGVVPQFDQNMTKTSGHKSRYSRRRFVGGVLAFCQVCGDSSLDPMMWNISPIRILCRYPELKIDLRTFYCIRLLIERHGGYLEIKDAVKESARDYWEDSRLEFRQRALAEALRFY